ncbi:transglutaminase family protein [Litoreibacter janthinus]|uniref:Transglutaminase-like enzyme, putative cysteine protease n=1 Tax=Litoreibacter janthinus TaxID=670154 RepID=A0A1I6FR95_9RHOB|nr:transglutaminase family protein [Litoreibacter janthinus]SFR32461.1 Transglutaminase-like enzyme, putative cysteine protease [Litoreibacter janthinus]
MLLSVNHITRYSYDHPVSYALQKVRLRPQTSCMQEVSDWSLTIEGGKIEAGYTDHYGNHVDLLSIDPDAKALSISAHGSVRTEDRAGMLGKTYGVAPLWHFLQPTALTKPGATVVGLSKKITAASSILNGLHALSEAVLKAMPYESGHTDMETNVEQALKLGHGVCQDHANVFISAARAAGVPARYVSGYLMMTDRVDQDASHAWAEAHLDDLGWVGFDVSNGIAPDEKYIRIAIGTDAHAAAPISGLRMGSGNEAMIVSLQVQQ